MDDRRRSLLALLAAVGAGCLGSSDPGTDPGTESRTEPDGGTHEPTPTRGTPSETEEELLAALVAGNTHFALALHRELVAESPESNLFASPYSISLALAMTWAGARGETEDRMAEALRFLLDRDDLHPAFEALNAAVVPEPEAETGSDGDENEGTDEGADENETEGGDEDDGAEKFQLRVANALWGRDGFPFAESFLDTVREHYGAGLREVDYQADPDAAREVINDWVAERTEEKITDLLPDGSITPSTVLVLTNAIYFKAKWANTFDDEATSERSFTSLDGSARDVPMMSQTDTFPYAEVDGHQVVDLPYAGGDASMVVVLPAEGTFEEFEADLDGERLASLFDALETTGGRVALPHFAIESSFSLRAALSALGMGVAFDPNEANFEGMVEPGADAPALYVDDAYHQSFVEVDEDGTEAAAATGVAVEPTSAPQETFEMVVDRPFLFLVRETETDTVLFAGRAVDAEEFAG